MFFFFKILFPDQKMKDHQLKLSYKVNILMKSLNKHIKENLTIPQNKDDKIEVELYKKLEKIMTIQTEL